jgi:hypothetical protein
VLNGQRGTIVFDIPIESPPSEHARWLGELSVALDRAVELLPELILISRDRMEAIEVYARIEAARSEIHSLQACDWMPSGTEFSSKWRQFQPHIIDGFCC